MADDRGNHMAWIKGIFIALGALLTLIAGIVLYVTQWLDPNDLKPTLIRMAEQQQIALTIGGHIEWSFYPWLGVSIRQVQAETAAARLEAERLEGSLSLLSLLSDTLVIDRLTAVSPKLTILEATVRTNQVEGSTPPRQATPLIIRELAITEGQLAGLPNGWAINDFDLNVEALSPGSESALNFSATLTDNTRSIPLALTATVVPSIAFDAVALRNPKLTSDALDLSMAGVISFALNGAVSGEGRIVVQPFSPRQWFEGINQPLPTTVDATVWQSLQGSLNLKWSNSLISAQQIFFALDQSRLKGNLDLNTNPWDVDLNLVLTELNLDRYRAGPNESKNTSPESATPFAPPPGAYRLDIGQLTVNSIPLTDIGVELGIQPEEITLGRLDATVFGGQIRGSGTHLIAPQITTISGSIEQLDIAQWPLEAPLDDLSGQVSGTYDLNFAGLTSDEAKSSLSGPVRVQVTEAKLGALGVSDALCQLANQPVRPAEEVDDTLAIRGEFNEGIATISSMSAKIANIGLTADGRFSLVSTALNLSGQAAIPADGAIGTCDAPVALRGLMLPLTCRGQLSEQTIACGLDRHALQRSLSRVVEDKAKERLNQEVQKQLNKALEDRLEGQAKDLLQNLFNR